MATREFNRVTTVIYDPVPANVAAMRGALYDIGIRNIDIFDNLKMLQIRLTNQLYDLVIGEVSSASDPFIAFVRDVRRGAASRNPFAPIVATTSILSAPLVRAAIDAGVDDIMGRPFSYKQVSQRIFALIEARKPFVVTSDYVGPDRRSVPRPGSAPAKFIDAPNTLCAKTRGDAEGLREAEKMIAQRSQELMRERIKRLGLRIRSMAEELGSDAQIAKNVEKAGDLGKFTTAHKRSATADELIGFCNEFRRSVKLAGYEQPDSMTRTIVEAAESIKRNGFSAGEAESIAELTRAVEILTDPDIDPGEALRRVQKAAMIVAQGRKSNVKLAANG
ncbi:MAG: hypothetical protein Tsb0010_00850 [Parvularculaceae bacterium]